MFNKLFDKLIIFLYRSYHQIKHFIYLKNFEKKHLTFGIINGKLQITSTSHKDFIDSVQKRINKFGKAKSQKDFIRLALNESLNGCNYIIFSPSEDDYTFVQFWTGGHTLKYNFFANEVNKLSKYFLTTIGLLSEMGFVNDSVDGYRGRMTFKIDKGADYISVDANFRKDIESAAEFTDVVFKQIYKTGNKKIIASVE